MKKLVRIVSLLILITSSYQIKAQTVASMLVIKDKIDNIMARTENLIDRQRQQTFIDLAALTSYSFDRLEGQLNDLDRMLTKKERNLYNQLEILAEKAEAAIDNQREELFIDLNTTIGNTLAEIPFFKKIPYPTNTKIPFISAEIIDTINITIKGIKLNNNKNFASINGIKSVETLIESNNKITFRIPVSPESLKIGSRNTLEITLYKRKNKKYHYKVPLWAYPEQLATIKFQYTYTKNVREFSNASQDIRVRSANACSWTTHSQNITRQNNGQWKILPGSVSSQRISNAPGGGEARIGTVTDFNFGTQVDARSDCRGSRVLNPRRGTSHYRFNWREYRDTPTEFDKIQTQILKFNGSYVLSEDLGITRFKKATIIYYNGQEFSFSDNSWTDGVVEYIYNAERDTFSVKSNFIGLTD